MLILKAPLQLPQVSNVSITNSYDIGRFGYTTGNELVIGDDNGTGRSFFPHNNTEILTEIGSKTHRVFNLMNRRQFGDDFYITEPVESTGEFQTVKLPDYEGAYGYNVMFRRNSSTLLTIGVWDYQNNVPFLRFKDYAVMCSAASASIDDLQYEPGIIEFILKVNDEEVFIDEVYYRTLLVKNDTGVPLQLFIKKISIEP